MLGPLMIALCLAGGRDERIPVVLTTDFGVETDDQWALAHLALSPRVDLRGVVATLSPSFPVKPADASADKARAFLAELRPARMPLVVAGSNVPMADRTKPLPGAGVDLILKATKDGTPERRVKLLVIGTATDAASALLIDPTLADRVEVVAMAFDGWPEGKDPWNVKNDVKAWQALLDAKVPLVVGDGAVGKKALRMSSQEARANFGKAGPRGMLLVDILERWLKKEPAMIAKTTGEAGVWPIWDEITVAHILGWTETEVHPRPRLRDDLTFDHPQGRGSITWVTSLETRKLWADLAEILAEGR